MKHNVVIIIVSMLAALTSCKNNKPSTDLTKENLIPKVVSVQATGNTFELTKESAIYVGGPSAELLNIGHYLAEKLRPSTGFELKVISVKEKPAEGNIYLSLAPDNASLGDEGYDLEITEDLLTVRAFKPAGIFRSVQTIRQLLPPNVELSTPQQGPWTIATGTIHDFPTYAWRGTMLDVARHFFGVEDVKRYIDLISYYKINILHLHLSDDQGWRIEIKSWPNLAHHGGSTQVGGGRGGYYTQKQYADLVAYAKHHYITIVPEIDLPGHINSALASYGELNGGTIVPTEGHVKILKRKKSFLSKKPKPTPLYTGVEVGFSTLRADKEITFRFIDDVIRELSSITPTPYIHIGGDEAQVTKKEDYITFINRIKEIVKRHGKQMVGWEEIAQGKIDSGVITQLWHSSEYGVMAVGKGSKLIMSPAKKAYLDMQYDASTKLGLHWAAYIEVDSAYAWDPATYIKGISEKNILGVEAPLWTETVTTMDDIEYMVFPRLPGYAEIGWTPATGRSWEEYKVRLGKHASRFKALGINFYKSKRVPWLE